MPIDKENQPVYKQYSITVERMLVEFHKVPINTAKKMVTGLFDGLSNLALHQEPYLTAADLMGEPAAITNLRYKLHRTRAVEIWNEVATSF